MMHGSTHRSDCELHAWALAGERGEGASIHFSCLQRLASCCPAALLLLFNFSFTKTRQSDLEIPITFVVVTIEYFYRVFP